MNNTDRFTGKARAYAQGRPDYPASVVGLLTRESRRENPRLADIGSGTGILSRAMLERGWTVYGVEPNDDMRKEAEKRLSAAFKRECRRILFGGGKVALIWNSRVEDSPVVREEGNIHRLYCPCFYGFSGGLEKLTDSIGAFFNHRFQVFRFPNDLSYTREQYLRRMMSTSYALTEGGEERSSWLGALEKLFDRFETEGRVTVPNETVVYLGKC